MIVGIKDGIKLFGISIMTCCAVFVCTLFINYNMDLAGIREQITDAYSMIAYDALVSTGKIVSALAGGCLLLISGIMLLFYIKNYIDTHKKELGILKALGYSTLRIAGDFRIFAVSVFIGTLLGFGGASLMMPHFYQTQNREGLLPDVTVHFHPALFAALVVMPTFMFGMLAVFYACIQLRRPTIDLLKEKMQYPAKPVKRKESKRDSADETGFLKDVQSATLRTRKELLFFVIFGAFCYSSMMQMAGSMEELASEMSAVMIFLIGVILSCVSLFLAITTVVHGNTKTIAMMRVFGYTSKDCKAAVLGGYRIPAYIGFVMGTLYQYGLLKTMVTVVFKDWENIPEYTFDVQTCILVLISFIILYELLMYWYAGQIRRISLKEVMME